MIRNVAFKSKKYSKFINEKYVSLATVYSEEGLDINAEVYNLIF